jgi:hypothetical protein
VRVGVFRRLALLPLLFVLAANTAEAGRRPFIWTWDTEIVPQGDLELEQWLWAKGRTEAAPNRLATNWIWWGPVYGVNDYVELAVPFQVIANRDVTQLESFEADFRIRLLPRGEEAFVTPLVRLAWHHGIPGNVPSRFDGNLVLRFQNEGMHATVDLGSQLALPSLRGGDAPASMLLTWAAGVAVPVDEGNFTFALETFGEIPALASTAKIHGFVGPSIGITKGRVWATLGVLIGLTPVFPDTPQFMPRLIWAVAL